VHLEVSVRAERALPKVCDDRGRLSRALCDHGGDGGAIDRATVREEASLFVPRLLRRLDAERHVEGAKEAR